MSKKVLIADPLSPLAAEIFHQKGIEADSKTGLSKPELQAIISEYEGLVVRSQTRPDADIIAAGTRLRIIGRAGIGVDNIDIEAATRKGIIVMNAPHGNAVTTAEHTIAMLFAAARKIPEASYLTQKGEWPKKDFMGTELTGKTIGLIGCGNIGSIVAERAIGLKLKVIAHDPFLTFERALELGVGKVELPQLLASADIISLHTPLTERTSNILSAEALASTRKGVIIINCARGGLVDEQALRQGLDSGHIAAAALDVFAEEPARSSPLFGAPGFVATPHLGASSHEAQEKVAMQIAEQMSDYLLNGAINNAINTPSLSAEEALRLGPLIGLAEKLGMFAGQITDGNLSGVEIDYEGEVTSLNTEPITAAAITGLLRPIMTEVNMVSAPGLLEQQGIPLKHGYNNTSPIYDSLIRIRIHVNGRPRSVAGALINAQPRIVEVKGMNLDARFRPYTLLVNNIDAPGFIGFVGILLGEAGINIATFNLGRESKGKEAIAMIGVDQYVPDNVLETLRAHEQVRYARLLKF